MEKCKGQRKVYLDALRIIAIFFVIFNHTVGYDIYGQTQNVLQTWFYMFVAIFTKINVPIFFMISGAVLLGKEENIQQVLKKRASKILVVIVTFSTLLYFLQASMFNVWQKPFKIVSNILSGNFESTYWYLYAYLGMVLMLPFLRKIANNLKQQEFIYLIILHFIFVSIIPIIRYFTSVSIGMDFKLYLSVPIITEKAIFFVLLGYFLDNKVEIKNIRKEQLVKLLVLSIIGIIIPSILTYHQGIRKSFSQDFVELFDYVIAIFIFLLVKYLFINKKIFEKNTKIKDNICKIGQLTFGMYLLDPFVKMFLYTNTFMMFKGKLSFFVISFIWCIISMFFSGIITFGIKQIPKVKQIL